MDDTKILENGLVFEQFSRTTVSVPLLSVWIVDNGRWITVDRHTFDRAAMIR